MQTAAPPTTHPLRDSRVVLTLGMHGSASTWAFNIARELMIAAFGADAVVSFFANTAAELLAETPIGRHVVCKTHGWPQLEVFAHLTAATMVISVRDPRDCVFSLADRFNVAFDVAVHGIEQDCRLISACVAAGHPFLRYEQHFHDRPATVAELARHIGLAVGDEAMSGMFERYRTDAVRAFAATLPSLPPERLLGDQDPLLYDSVTHIHQTHIGDGRTGKWRERLDEPQRIALSSRFAPFLKAFGYPAQ